MNQDIILLGMQQQGAEPVTIEEIHMTASFSEKDEPMMRELHMTVSFADPL